MITVKMNSIKFTPRRTQAAAYAAVIVHDRRTAGKTSCRFDLDLFFRQRLMGIFERITVIDRLIHAFFLSARMIVVVHFDIVLVQHDELSSVLADGH